MSGLRRSKKNGKRFAMSQQTHRPTPGLLPALLVISTAALALEILQMRIFAFSLWHHLAFLVISIAILGFGAAGALLGAFRPLREAPLSPSLAWAALLFAPASLAGPFFLAGHPLDIFGPIGREDLGWVLLYYILFLLPYFFAGYVISLALAREPFRVGRLYFANMVGSGLGCFLIFGTLLPLGAEGTLFLLASAGGLTALFLARGKGMKVLAASACLLFLAPIPWADRLLTLQPARSKLLAQAQRLPGTRSLARKWTPLDRIDLVKNPGFDGLYIFQDGDAPAPMPRFGAPLSPGEIHSVAYTVTKKPKVLVIGVGGGFDVKVALEKGASSVTGVEVNPVTLGLYTSPEYKEISGDPLGRKKVRLEVAEGRHFVRSSPDKFDLIQMSGVDTYTALASGAYVLSESYLYTQEAFQDYLDHLTPRGVLAIIRFAFPAPRETLRIMVLACRALAKAGAREPWRHVAVIRAGTPDSGSNPFTKVTSLGAVLVSRSPFTKEQASALKEWARKNGHIQDYIPGEEGRFTPAEIALLEKLIRRDPRYQDYRVDPSGMNPFHAYAKALREGKEKEFLASYPYDVTPVTDDRPFFFNQHRFSSVLDWILGKDEKLPPPGQVPWSAMTLLFQTRPVGLTLLFLTLLQLAFLVGIFVFLPLLFMGRRKEGPSPSPLLPLGYFLCLGLGYIFLMISAMQRFGLVLGHPSYSISITMATFLLASGLGSLVSGKVPSPSSSRVLGVTALLLLLQAAAFHLFLPALSRALLPAGLTTRALVVIALLSPGAFAMGFCFPLGIRLVSAMRPAFVPWAYGVNTGASVIGSVLAVILAMTLGFSGVQWVSTALYAAAAWIMFRMTAPAPGR